MNTTDYMTKLKEEIGLAIFSTVDAAGQPDSRYINIGMANESGVFFMTNRQTNFYQQLVAHPYTAITGMARKDGEIEVVRIKGQVQAIGREKLVEVLKDNPYVQDVYPDEKDRADVQVFQVFKGTGNYRHLQKQIEKDFTFGEEI